ncbi:uncharacterized protein si:ch211-218d20.15 isoform X2 [Colossoma macropomum]|uniref:uncharacterized protein si:ch211-218d20.15 isoform X2 n=1 Tax=Colossoma macropomum TaxID=42526 RepID=UPI0018643123|nr:uncharacterized protein si:ch211-218d20.15 isoform X2 [Colossoma macropomum]
MAAVSLTEPLCQPCGYNSRFKVELFVKKPLMPIHLSPEQVALEMLCFCSQLDLLIRAQVHQFQGQLKQDTSPEELESFQKQGAEIIDQMNQRLEHLPKPAPLLEDYLDIAGLSVMFPRVEVYIIHGSPVYMLERPPLDGYFPHLGRLNQLLVLSQQLEDDVKHLGSHKYIAHQLAVIYKDIEANFKQMKMSLVTEEGSKQEPQLPAQYISWISQLTHNIISTVSSLTEELTEELSPVMAFVSKWS